MLGIALSTLRSRKSGTLGATVAVALAVVLVVSCGILLESSLRAPIEVERLASAGIVVQKTPTITGNGSFSVALPEKTTVPAALADRLRKLPGVRAAVADRSFDLVVVAHGGQLLTGRAGAPTVGHGWGSRRLEATSAMRGRAPDRANEVAIDADLASRARLSLGDLVRISTATTTGDYTVVGVTDGRLGRSSSVYFDSATAAELADETDRADLIGLVLDPHADVHTVAERVRSELGPGLRVLTGEKRGEAEAPDDALSRSDVAAGLTTFGVLAAFVAIFVVASTFALSVQQRHRELALLRAIGSTPRQVRRMVAAEALLVSVLATLVGAPIGCFAARIEQNLFTRVDLLPEGLALSIGVLPFLAGLAVAIVTTQLAVYASARRASRIRPTEALRETAVRGRAISWFRALAGVAVFVGGLAVLVTSASRDAPAATLVWMLAVALLGPLLAWPFAWMIGLPLAWFGRAPGTLARANTSANLRRMASVATPVTLALSLVCAIYFGKALLREQTVQQADDRTIADFVIEPRVGAGVSRSAAEALRKVEGIERVSGSLGTSVVVAIDGRNLGVVPARGVDPGTLRDVIDLGVESGSLASLHGHSVAVAALSAHQFGWRVGDDVHLWLGDGTPVTLRVAATFARPLGFGEIVVPRELLRGHVTHAFNDAVFVKGDVSQRSLGEALVALRAADPGVEIVPAHAYDDGLVAAARHDSLPVYILLGLIAVFCALAVVNAVAMSIAERAREFALLRLIGADRRQVRNMVRSESLIMLAFGVVVGTAIAFPGLALFSRDLTGSWVPDVPLGLYVVLAGFYTVLGLAAAIVPTRIALRMNPVGAMVSRE